MIFSKGKMFFCTKHLKDNVKDHLKDSDPSARSEIMSQIFGQHGWGEGGLTDAIDKDDFLKKKIAIDISAFPPGKFDQVAKKILHNVLLRQECRGAIEPNMTSNQVESVNSQTKLYANFRIEKLPDLIDILRDQADNARLEFIQAFMGRGGIILEGPLGRQFSFRPDVWEMKTPAQKDTAFSSFARGGRRILNQNDTVTSTKKGLYTMDHVGGVKQKKNARKRPSRQRTLTLTPGRGVKRSRTEEDDE